MRPICTASGAEGGAIAPDRQALGPDLRVAVPGLAVADAAPGRQPVRRRAQASGVAPGVFPFALPHTVERSVECEGVVLNGFGGHKPTPGGAADPHTCAGAIQEAVQVIREVVTQMGEQWNAQA